ncbi:hypothetical protein [Actinophytocola xanthii]|uniref:hypothetical protein n=1 Tax=Actinophytocola xanthii TaxID=1912961 RepID=UPI00117744BA|nr:hypothetical protein [Actinophytocola xanthii]
MSDNYWESVTYSEAPLAALERQDASVVFEWVQEHLPIAGSKIDWTRVQGKHDHWKFDNHEQLDAKAIEEICKRVQQDSIVEHVGDGLSPVGVLFGESSVAAIVGALLEIPEHHYFLASDRSWIVVVTTEGDLDILERGAERID